MATFSQAPHSVCEAPWYRRYSFGLVFPAIAFGLEMAWPAFRLGAAFSLFYAAVALAAWYGGLGAGLFATLTSSVAVDYFILKPPLNFVTDPEDILRLATFAFVAVLISTIVRQRSSAQQALWESEASGRERDAELQSSRQRLQAAQQAAGFGTWEWNIRSGALKWSPEIFAMHGLHPDEFDGTIESWYKTIHPDDILRVRASVEQLLRHPGEYEVEHRTVWKDGSIHWITGRGAVLTDASGAPECMVGIGLDITARKEADAALVRAEKLAASGRMAATIAHEVNNPLEAATNLIYIVNTSPRLPADLSPYLQAADQELRRVAHITKQTLGFYRNTTAPEVVNVRQALDDLLRVYSGKIRAKNIHVEKEYRTDLSICAFRGEILQIFSNLVSNAIEAARQYGHLTLRVCEGQNPNRSGQKGVTAEIEDDGPGITPEHLNKIFEPFFTTKKDSGTGLGLWVAKDLVEKNHGAIAVRTATETGSSGTCFSVFFPASASKEVVAA